MTVHMCHAHCGRRCPPRHLMCATCWSMVPKPLGDLVYRYFHAGRAAGAHPSGQWMLAAEAACGLVQVKLGLPLRGFTSAMSYARACVGEDEADRVAAEIASIIETTSDPAARAVLDVIRERWSTP